MAAIQVGGLGSGIDINGLLVQLRQAEQMRLQPLQKEQQATQGKISAFGSLKSALTSLQDATKALNEAKTFRQMSSTISGKGVSVIAGAEAKAGSYTIKVDSLASSHTLATQGVATRNEALIGAGTLTLQVGQGDAVDIEIAEGSTLEQIRSAINASKSGVTASIINTGDANEPFRLVVTSDKTGTDAQINMSFAGTGDLQGLLNDSGNGGTLVETQAATNASLTINGMSVTSQSNTVEGAIEGVTLSINEVGEQQRLEISVDNDKIKESINAFVKAYNSYINVSKSVTAFNEDPAQSGKLIGDSTVRNIDNRIRSVLMNADEDGAFRVMAEFGVKLTPGGTLEVDDDKLTEMLATKGSDVAAFFTGEVYNTGFASRLNKELETALKFEGSIELATEGLKERAKSLSERFDRDMDRIEVTIERFRVQFAEMDKLVGSMTSMMSYLSQQFEAMAAQTRTK